MHHTYLNQPKIQLLQQQQHIQQHIQWNPTKQNKPNQSRYEQKENGNKQTVTTMQLSKHNKHQTR